MEHRYSPVARFLLSCEPEPNSTPLQTTVAIVATYTVFALASIAIPLNVMEDLRTGYSSHITVQIAFLVLVSASVVSFWVARRLRLSRVLIGLAVSVLAGHIVGTGGGVRGLGLLYVVAGYSMLYYVVGFAFAVALPAFVFFGTLIRSSFGDFGPNSYFNDPVYLRLYLLLLGVIGVLSIVMVIFQRRMIAQLAKGAYVDEMTGLSNRTRFEEQLHQIVTGERRYAAEFGVIAIKIHKFARINSYFGPGRSDLVIQSIAARIKEAAGERAIVGRYTGTLFMVLSEAHSFEELESLAGELQDAVKRRHSVEDATATVEAALAVTRFPEDGERSDRLITNLLTTVARRSDRGGGVSFFNEASFRAENQNYSLRQQLTGAIERDELSLVYHPIVDLESGDALGAEVLLRWHNQRFGFVSPGQFIPLAEEMGLTREITPWVMKTAARELARLDSYEHGPTLRHSINLSPLDLTEPSFINQVDRWIAAEHVTASRFEFEITEGIVVDQNPRVKETLATLRERGFTVAMDDFGTGYSNLIYLNELHLSTVKIDQSFVRQIQTEEQTSPVIEAIISMARSFDLSVTAEGVETPEQVEYLIRCGCRIAQGYLFAKPLSIAQYAEWLAARLAAPVSQFPAI
ncbi:MAG: putative bifunctional diguanylate cyclase/phosphodiesterase [Spirochaetota bacterium]